MCPVWARDWTSGFCSLRISFFQTTEKTKVASFVQPAFSNATWYPCTNSLFVCQTYLRVQYCCFLLCASTLVSELSLQNQVLFKNWRLLYFVLRYFILLSQNEQSFHMKNEAVVSFVASSTFKANSSPLFLEQGAEVLQKCQTHFHFGSHWDHECPKRRQPVCIDKTTH